MLQITLGRYEYFVDERQEFVSIKERTIHLEHSLLSISKWESKWKKPFLGDRLKTPEEALDYFRCMTIEKDVDPASYYALTPEQIDRILAYIDEERTATTIRNAASPKKSREIVTSEVIYCSMVMLQIPFEAEKWHLSRLLKLIEVCGIKNAPPKKMSKREIFARNKALNNARRQRLNSKG